MNLMFAQNLNQVTVKISQTGNTIVSDSLPFFPNSIDISCTPSGTKLEISDFLVDGKEIKIFPGKSLEHDTAYIVRYRQFDLAVFRPLRLVDTSEISNQKENPFLAYQFSEDKKTGTGFGNLNYRGSISRSILAGNNQDLSLNSTLNLQFSGKIDDETEIAAVVTDNNIPIQPDGATRQIQEFDKIYIQVKRRNSSLLAGDYEINAPEGYFMKYFKKLRGATISNTTKSGNKTLNSKASFAISRGKFSRMVINGIEGNQGPYKLNGSGGESFIIILSGTEKVFVDGMVMQRGLQDDYTIDYNRGDITFTPRRMITKDSRIIVEFEYVVQNYVRSIATISETVKINKSTVSVNLYTEQDHKNSSQTPLTTLEKTALSQAGDNTSLAIVASIDTSNADPVKYRLTDTLGFTSVLVYSPNNPNAKYTASFAFVGNGNGDYILDTEKGVNGRVYKWVAPNTNGTKNGNYSPVRKLIAPTLQQMATVSIATPIFKKILVNGELAYTRLDKNRFSDNDNSDDNGFGTKFSLTRQDSIGKKGNMLGVKSYAETEFVNKNFSPLNPYRNAEFNRDYNYKPLNVDEWWINAGIQLTKSNTFSLKYTYNSFSQSNLFKANKHDFSNRYVKKTWTSILESSYLLTSGNQEKSWFLRPKYELSKTLLSTQDLTLKIFADGESNERRSLQADTLLVTSFRYINMGAGVSYKPVSKLNSSFNFSRRIDDLPVKNEFKMLSVADQFGLENNFKIKKNQTVQLIAQYRILNVTSVKTNLKNAESYLGRFQHNIRTKDGSMSNLLSYEIGSGQEQKIDYYYQEVSPGLGQYEYNDYNGDGVKQLDEFEIATSVDKAKFVRLIVLSNDFVKTDNLSITENLSLGFPSAWSNAGVFKKALQKLNWVSSVQFNRKLKESKISQVWNPFSAFDEVSQLALLGYFYSSVLQVNRGKPGYELQFGTNGTSNKQLLTSGLEGRTTKEFFQFTRINLSPKWQFENRMSVSSIVSTADLFKSRNFILQVQKTEPAIILNSSLHTRIALKGKWEAGKTNETVNGVSSDAKQISAEVRHNTSNRSSLNGKFTFTDIKFEGNQSSPAGFALLQGLNNGKNLQLNVDIDYRLTQKLFLNVGYEVRKLGDSKLIHVFRTQLKADF